MLEKYYGEFDVEEKPVNGYDLTISYDLSKMPSVASEKTSNLSSAQKKELKKKKKEQYKELTKVVDELGFQLACFRRNFFAAPFEKVIGAVISGNWSGNDIEFCSRDAEAIWLIPGKDRVNCFFSIHFEGEIDRAICRLIKNEMEETMQ